MVKLMKVNGRPIRSMVKDYLDGLMGTIMKESGGMMKEMVLEHSISLMETNLLVNLQMGRGMGMGYLNGAREIILKEYG